MATVTSPLRYMGKAPNSDWAVYSLGVSGVEAIPQSIPLPSEKFVCLLAWDASRETVGLLAAVAEKLLKLGCVYFCCWGKDCEHVHDVVDEVVVGDGTPSASWSNIMTTWHSKESITEAVDFFLDYACPDDMYIDACSTALAVIIGSEYEATEVELSIAVKLANPPSNNPLNRTARKRVAG